jgi:hypothetical protein
MPFPEFDAKVTTNGLPVLRVGHELLKCTA